MGKDYSTFDDGLLLLLYKRISNKVKNITLKKVLVVIKLYNLERLLLANILILLDKRGFVLKTPEDVTLIPINAVKKNENTDKGK